MESIFDHYKEREEHTATLAEDALQLQNEINLNDENENPSPVCWSNLSTNEERCKIITGFTPREFNDLYDIISADIEENIGRGPRSKISKQDKLLMVLCYLKHYETIDKMRDTFSISKSYLHTVLQKTINSISPVLYNHFVIDLNDRIDDSSEEELLLFPEAKFVIDVTFQSIWTPTGTYDEKKLYFSGKHKMYGLKSQCIHDRKGRLVHCVSGEIGSIHDFTICKNSMDQVKSILQKETEEDEEEEYWTILADSGYQGLQEYVDVVLPYKKKPNKQLTKVQQKTQQRFGS